MVELESFPNNNRRKSLITMAEAAATATMTLKRRGYFAGSNPTRRVHTSSTSHRSLITCCSFFLSIVIISTLTNSIFAAQLSQIVSREHDHKRLFDNANNSNQNQPAELTAINALPAHSATPKVVIEVAATPIVTTSSSAAIIDEQQDDLSLIEDLINDNLGQSAAIEVSVDRAVSDEVDETTDCDVSKATVVIEYDQQGYNLSTSEASTALAPTTSTATATPSSSVKRDEQSLVEYPTINRPQADKESSASHKSDAFNLTDARAIESPASNSVNGHNEKELEVESTNDQPVAAKLVATDEGLALVQTGQQLRQQPSLRSKPDGTRDIRLAADEVAQTNASQIISTLLKKKPYVKYWTAEQKWDDLFTRLTSVQAAMKDLIMKNFLKDADYYADLSISRQCADDLKWIRSYAKQSSNYRFLVHMFDSTGKSESGMLTGNLANLGHPVQCIKARAPSRPTNETFEERYFDQQTAALGERFRGKYCLASVRPVLPQKPHLVSRFSHIMDANLLSNISFTGLPVPQLKRLAQQTEIPNREIHKFFDREHARTDQIPFESELYQHLIEARNFMFSLPRFTGVCYPSSCSREDVRATLQKTFDDEHQVVDIEFECEQEEVSSWEWFSTPRVVAYLFLALFGSVSLLASVTRHILVDRLNINKDRLPEGSRLASLIRVLDLMSMDKCAGNLFIKTNRASPIINTARIENNRSTSIDALKGFLVLMLVYSELVYLGCLPVPFMWAKWADAMFPFYRSWSTQIFLNTPVWTEAFYIISAYLIGMKLLENCRPKVGQNKPPRVPEFFTFIMKRYIRLLLPMIAFILLNYVWPRLSNGFVMQDQANKLMKPCDAYGWTNVLMFHNHNGLNETCLWPSHVSASFFQLHILSYPILLLMLISLRTNAEAVGVRKIISTFLMVSGLFMAGAFALVGLVYPAQVASKQELIVPFLIDYIDYDNYKRVIEWTVLPTYNHLTSYMIGLTLAYIVVRKRLRNELRRSSGQDWLGCYVHREGSFESVLSSSTQALESKPNSKTVSKPIMNPAFYSASQMSDEGPQEQSLTSRLIHWTISGFFLVLILISTTASWYWNGLGQPMTPNQTFWYLCLTKLLFCIAFGYLFITHFATRRNSINPWMITRFLVPIGRMSLTVFYVSWLVIWFDMLASLYQWHPSHYFVFEKFNEITFITLILGMVVYGALEGVFKNIQLVGRKEKFDRMVAQGSMSPMQGFEALFIPLPADSDPAIGAGLSVAANNVHGGKTAIDKSVKPYSPSYISQQPEVASTRDQSGSEGGGRRLSIADQYKLNAELRANYSFASIGLYESAGATSDLNRSDQQSSSSQG